MIPRKHKLAIDHLRIAIRQSEHPLTEIAKRSGVSYQPLWKWYTKRQPGIGLRDGEKVYYFLTGKTFTDNQ